jgi:glycine cleavage system regulatory protein
MDADPITQAEQILTEAQRKLDLQLDMQETQVHMLERMTGLSHVQAHHAYEVYFAELTKMAKKEGMTLPELQQHLGQSHNLILLGMVAGGIHAETDIRFGSTGPDDDDVV